MSSIEVQIEERRIEGVRCNTTLPTNDEDPSLVFIILPLAGWLVDPDMKLHITFVVEKVTAAGTTPTVANVAATDKIGIVNYGLMSMWKTIDMTINQKSIIPINNSVPYTSLVRMYQELDADGRKSKLTWSGWKADEQGAFENYTISTTDNEAFTHRHALIIDGKEVEFFGPVVLGPLRQKKPFVDDAEITLTFTRAPAPFFLVGDPGTATNLSFRITIKKAILYVKRLKMRPGTRLGREVAYSYTSYETRHVMVPSGGQVISTELLTGPCPNRVMIGMVPQKAFFGDLKKNPFHFPTYKIASLYMKLDQITSIPAEMYTTELATVGNKKVLTNVGRMYDEMMEILNDSRWLSHSWIGITSDDFFNGMFLMSFDLRSYPGGTGPNRDVVLRLEATFHENLPENILLVTVLEYDRLLTIPTGPGRGEVHVI